MFSSALQVIKMYHNSIMKNIFRLTILFLPMFCLSAHAQQSGTTPTPDYIDIRTGFSLDLPNGVFPTERVPYIVDELQLKRWDILRCPPSTQLVCFVNPPQNLQLQIQLLSTREKMTMEQIRNARVDLISKTPGLKLDDSEIIPDSTPTTLYLNAKYQSENLKLNFSEAVILAEPDRFFLLRVTTENKPDSEPDDLSRQTVHALTPTFNYFGEEMLQRRWSLARKVGHKLLEELTATPILAAEQTLWYQIANQNRPIGFRRVTTAYDDARQLQISTWTYIDNGPDALAFLNALARNPIPPQEDQTSIPLVGPVMISGYSSYQAVQRKETFSLWVRELQGRQYGCSEVGLWDGKGLTITRVEKSANESKPVSEDYNLEQNGYLTWSLDSIVGQILDTQTQQEYVFLKYANRQLGSIVYRVNGRRDDLVHIIAHNAAPGPVAELWVNGAGSIQQWRGNGIDMTITTLEQIKTKWDQQLQNLQPDKPLAPPPKNIENANLSE